jgi:hypothetical protein
MSVMLYLPSLFAFFPHMSMRTPCMSIGRKMKSLQRLNWRKRLVSFYRLLWNIQFCNCITSILYSHGRNSWNIWIKTDQLDVTCFFISLFTAQHVSNVSTSIFRSLGLIVDLFHVLHCPVRIQVLALASLFSGEWLVVTCVIVLISIFL